MRIDIVIPVYNKRPLLEDAVGSVVRASANHPSTRLWIVDHYSTDGSYEFLAERYGDHATMLRLRGGTISAVRNLGAKQGSAPVISFIDCDCLVPDDYFTRLERVFEETNAEATGCAVVLPPAPTWVEAVWTLMHDDGAEGARTWINSANFAVRRSTFEQIGGFSEQCETGEDAEICLRIRGAGGRLVSDTRLAVAHLDNAKTLPAFYRKERWRGLGMLSSASDGAIDKPTTMTIMHLVALIVGLTVVVLGPGALWARVSIALGLAFLAPAITVLYRRRFSVQRFGLAGGVLLYQLYYLARINALGIIAARALRATR